MAWFGRKKEVEREGEVCLENLCVTCKKNGECMDGLKYRRNTEAGELGIVDCESYRSR